MKHVFVILLSAFMVFGFSSCGEDDEIGQGASCDNAFTTYTNALSAFGSIDPMDAVAYEAACNDLKNALLDLIDDCNIQNIIGNLGIDQQEWNDIVSEIQNEDCTP